MLCTPAYAPAYDYGGPVTKVALLAQGLQRRGWEVEVWTADFSLKRGRVGQRRGELGGVPTRYFRRWFAYRWSPVAPGVVPAAARCQPTIAHVFGVRDGLTTLAALTFRARRIPYVLEPMGMLTPRVRTIPVKRAFDRVLGRRVVRGAAGLIVNSAVEREDAMRQAPGLRVWQRTNPLELPEGREGAPEQLRQRLGIPDSHLVAAFVGRVSTKKGLPLLAQAVGATPGVSLVVAGPDTGDGGEDQLRRAVDDAQIADRVHRIPAVWDGERDRLLASADFFVLPSQNENFGNAAAEASALGTPVIVSDQCGVAEIVTELDAGLVCGATAGSIAAALRRLRDDPSLRTRLGENGRQIRETLRPDHVVAQQIAIYEDALR